MGVSIGCKEALADAIGGDLDKENEDVDPPEVGGDLHPSTEGAPLLPCGGVLLTD